MADQIDNLINQERIRLLYKNTEMIVISQLLVVLIVFLMFWEQTPMLTLSIWGITFVGLTGFRFYNYRMFLRHQATEFDVARWERRFILGTALVGAMWGLLFILLLDSRQPDHILLVVVLFSGISTGGSAYLSASYKAFLVFLTPTTLPLLVGMYVIGKPAFAALGAVYFMVLVIVTKTYHRNIIEALSLRFQNTSLIENLEVEKQRAESNQSVAEQAVLAKDRFLASASHDLRQPLHAQGLYIDSLEHHVTDQGKHQLKALRKTNNALTRLLSSLLDVSRLNAKIVEVNPAHFRLQTLLRPIVEEYQARVDKQRVHITLECPPERVAHADTTLLERIVRNLLSNAIRYTESGSVVVSCDCKSNDVITLSVRDSGIGIPEQELDNIFEEYHQLHNPERDRDKGLGLGLAIVKKLCALMQFPLHCQSQPGEGSCFSVDIPRGLASEIPESVHHQKPEPVSNIRVLVIDDEDMILQGMEEFLSAWGYEVITAESSKDALATVDAAASIQMIVADYRLRDDKTGVEAIHDVRHHLQNKNIPAIIITGDTSEERLQEAKQSGFMLLHKPVAPGVLRNAIHIALDSAKHERPEDNDG